MGETLCGSDIAKAVYAYLHDEKCERAARLFCEDSRYMHDEDNLLKLGLRIRKIRQSVTLYDVYKFYIDVQDLVLDVFESELQDYEQTPEFEKLDAFEKVTLMRRLFANKCKCTCNCAKRSTLMELMPTLKRRLSANGTDEEIGQLFPVATVEQDLPGNRHPEKRRKIHDIKLLFPNRIDEATTSTETITIDNNNVKTPAKMSMCPPTSATKTPGIPGDIFTKSLMGYDFHTVLADSINNAFDGRDSLTGQLDNVLPTVLAETEQLPTYDQIVFDAIQNTNQFGFEMFDTNSIMSTSTPSKGSGADDVADAAAIDRPLNTPEPMNESIKQRLRPRKSNPSINSNVQSNETKRMSRAKGIRVLSNETIVGPSEPIVENLNDVIVVNSDSDETVTTPSMQPLQLAQQTYFLKFDPNQQNFQLEIPTQSTGEQTQSLQNNFNIPIVFDSMPYQMQTIIVDPQTIVGHNEFQSNQFFSAALGGAPVEKIGESRNRIIVIDNNEVNMEDNNQPILCTEEQTTITQPPAPLEKLSQIILDKTLAQVKQTECVIKIGTPKAQIKPNSIPSSSRSLSTPRRRNPHVRVLDFATPARFPLTEISEATNESSTFNASKLFALTPHNQTTTSSMPSSAPAKMSACVDSSKTKITKKVEAIADESSSADSAIPFGQENDEDTVISVGSDTPKVRKKQRRSCVRTLSSHKEINVAANENRFKRVAKTKKIICNGSDNSNDGQQGAEPVEVNKVDEPKIDPLEEWRRQREMSKNPMFFEQHLRENESKKQAIINADAPNRRKRRPQRKPAAKTKAKPVKKSAEKSEEKLTEKSHEKSTEQSNESCKSTDISFNSSLDTTLNSTQLRLEAKLLEENLASAKKVAPAKQTPAQFKKRKTPAKVHIKLMPSPKAKMNAKLKKTPKKLTIKKKSTGVEPEKSIKTAEAEESPESNSEVVIGVKDQMAVAVASAESELSNKSTQEDIEAAKDLINMKNYILQKEKDKKLSESTKKQDPSDSVFSSTSQINEIKSTTVSRTQLQDPNMSSLDTPFKDESGVLIFPRTPGINSILHSMATPVIRSGTNILDVSMFKNPHHFPTPNVPITPGSGLTPFKDLISPRGDQDVIYGAANRPTDYSSSSSYYKPDESDGIDKQIHASIRTRTNSSAYSADEFDYSQRDNSDAVFHENSSSASSGSSSDSCSESDTSSSSSDSNTSQVDIKVESTVEMTNLKEEEDEEDPSTQTIKSHLVSTTEVGIAQNILLAQPEAPIVDKKTEKAETLALMESKRLRIQERMRQTETQKITRTRPANKNLTTTIKRIERFRMPTTATRSPSKRKSSQPQRFVPQLNASTALEQKTQMIITQQVISEAISDNAIVDASDVGAIKKPDENMPSDSENIDAIAEHVRQISNNKDIEVQAPVKENAKKMSGKRLIGILEGKRHTKSDQIKAQFIDALPAKKPTRSRAKAMTINPIAPKQNAKKETLVKEPAASTSTATLELPKPMETEPEPTLTETTAAFTITNPMDNSKTPAKDRMKQQIRDIFGDMTDTETPIKSPPRNTVVPEKVQAPEESDTPEKMPEKAPQPALANSFEKENEDNDDCTNASMSSLSTDEYSSDEDDMEMVFSIDETDKKRYYFVQDTYDNKSSEKMETVRVANLQKFKRTIVIDGEKVVLTIDSEDELFSQDLESVADNTKKNILKEMTTSTTAENRIERKYDASPFSTSSPSEQTPLSPKPKFNIKHKSKDTKEEISQSKTCQTASEEPNRETKLNQININELLKKLHVDT